MVWKCEGVKGVGVEGCGRCGKCEGGSVEGV
jgi:hypothetical protein